MGTGVLVGVGFNPERARRMYVPFPLWLHGFLLPIVAMHLFLWRNMSRLTALLVSNIGREAGENGETGYCGEQTTLPVLPPLSAVTGEAFGI
ncbi:MAG: hypothetical protein D6706_18850 [Chloroflexi bacterium]|nr:MAG: hypothetical protein D6706_18850 [Chloroflexota bacterium]